MRKKVISLVLSAALIFSTLSIPAFAAETDALPETAPEETVEAAPETEAEVPADSAVEEENASSSDNIVIVLPSASSESSSSSDSSASSKTEEPKDQSKSDDASSASKTETTETSKETDTAEVEEEKGNGFTYVALGDSICSGVGLVTMEHGTSMVGVDVASNFKGYPEQCYVGQVAKTFDLDRDHAINLGLPALMSNDLVELLRDGKMNSMNMLSGCEYNYPQMREYIKSADVISIQIGSNDALVPCIVGLGNATNWKTEEAASIILSGDLRTTAGFSALVKSLSKYKLTTAEVNATWKLLTYGMGQICNEAYPTASENLRLIVEEIRKLNPDAQILLIGYTNPVPLISCWTKYFNKMNKYEKELASVYGLTYVSIPYTKTELDGHPTVSGHKYIARQISKAISDDIKNK